jgi:hypothetical protein
MATRTKVQVLSRMLPRIPDLDDLDIVYRSPAVIVKECGRTLGVAVQRMSRVWRLDNHGKYFVTLGLNAGKKSGSLTTMVGTEGEHINRCVREMQKEGV